MSDTPPLSGPYKALIDYIESKNFTHTANPQERKVTLTLNGKNANYRFVARITHDEEFLQVTAYYPFFVRDEKLRLSSAELITRANYCMPLGKFEMDLKDGEVRFHATHVIEGGILSQEMIERHMMTSYFTADRYFPAFMQHLHAGYTPEDAVYHAELDYHADQIEETPKPRPKPKSKPAPSGETSPNRQAAEPGPSATDPQPKAPAKPRLKREGDPSQGELPL